MSRFFKLLKGKQIADFDGANSNAVTDSQVANAGTDLFIQPSNRTELNDLITLNSARQYQRLFGGVPHPNLSEVVEVTIGDNPTTLLQPSAGQVFRIIAMAASNGAVGDQTVAISCTDGIVNLPLHDILTVAAGGADSILTPITNNGQDNSSPATFEVSNGAYLIAQASTDGDIKIQIAYHVIAER